MSAMGAAGGMPAMKMAASTSVAGASGAPGKAPTKVAGESGPGKDATQAGGAADAAAGASTLAGGGGTDLASVLQALTAVIKSLAEVVSKLGVKGGGGSSGCDMGAGHVMGVQGGAATNGQFVAKQVAAPVAATEDSAFEERVLQLINVERAKSGLAPVRYNGTLDTAAEKHNTQMAKVGQMAHDGIGDGDPGERIRAEGFRNAWGENVATGQTSPEQVVREWMASPDHRRNILDPNFRQMGVSYVTGANGRAYWAQEFGA